MVLVRRNDGCVWPFIIDSFNAVARTANVSRPILGWFPSVEAEVPVELIYDFASNVRRILREAQRATFAGRSFKDDYIRLLRFAVDYYEKELGAVPAEEAAGPGIARLPLLRTGSPSPEDRQYAVRGVRSPDEYGVPMHDAAAQGFRKLYFVDDLESAEKLNHRLQRQIPPDVGIVCEHHPQWIFTTYYKCFLHFVYIHPAPPLNPLPDSDDEDDDEDAEQRAAAG